MLDWQWYLEHALTSSIRFLFGAGWMYRFPSLYDKKIESRFGRVRGEAFDYFFDTYVGSVVTQITCLDLACGTGISATGIATRDGRIRVIGVDSSRAMLMRARHRARKEGVGKQCRFVQARIHDLSINSLSGLLGGRVETIDMITCALGFSVIRDWQEAFHNTFRLLDDDGLYVIFDQHAPGLYLEEFDAHQSRRSWELIEQNFLDSEVKWFDEVFIAIGRGKKRDIATWRS
jgi:ubiquinone/menaquinone biosynthesis C-methylase UbiE